MKAQELAKTHEGNAANAVLTVRALSVRTRADMVRAVEFIRDMMDGVDRIDGAIEEYVKPLEVNIKELKGFFRTPKTMFQTAIGAAKSSLYDAMKAEEGERVYEEQKLFAESDRKREELFQASIAEKDPAKAKELSMQADMVVAPALSEQTSIQGVHIREAWKAQVVDMELFVTAVASGDLPVSLLKVDTMALNKMASAQKGLGKIPGVTFKPEETLVVRR